MGKPASRVKKQGLDSLNRGIDALEIIAERGAVKLAELPELLETSRATAYRVLSTLQSRGYLEHVPDDHSYRLGPGAVILAARTHTASLIRLAEPAMAALREASGETVNLAAFRGGRLVYVSILEGFHAMRMSGTVGEEVPLHATALGKSVLSVLPDERRRALLGRAPFPKHTASTLRHWPQLERDLAATERRGYAIDNEEMDFGAVCLGAPILTDNGEPAGAISVAGLAGRAVGEKQAELGDAVAAWARRISAQLRQDGGTRSRKGSE